MNEPFLLRPAYKDYLWGGRRLKDDFGKETDLSPLAESWECSTHPDGESTVFGGRHNGEPLPQVVKENPGYMGTHPLSHGLPPGQIPVLVKLIDASERLSVQVHPSDSYAREHEGGRLGKTEMWYVLGAGKDAELAYGFLHDMDRDTLEKVTADGTLLNHLQYVGVKKNDVFFLPAGTVHALGAGILVAEIQENSNLTYRLYDYGRTDRAGRTRPLHIREALEAADLRAAVHPRQPMRVLRYEPGFAAELLCRCRYFQTERILLNTERVRGMAALQTGDGTFNVLLCTDGCGVLYWDWGMIPFFKGDSIFVPASSVLCRLHGKAQMLRVSC